MLSLFESLLLSLKKRRGGGEGGRHLPPNDLPTAQVASGGGGQSCDLDLSCVGGIYSLGHLGGVAFLLMSPPVCPGGFSFHPGKRLFLSWGSVAGSGNNFSPLCAPRPDAPRRRRAGGGTGRGERRGQRRTQRARGAQVPCRAATPAPLPPAPSPPVPGPQAMPAGRPPNFAGSPEGLRRPAPPRRAPTRSLHVNGSSHASQ